MSNVLSQIPPWLFSKRTGILLAWAVAIVLAGWRLDHSRNEFSNKTDTPDDAQRFDGNRGHTYIDFGGQWVMGRLAATGQLKHLYDRKAQWVVVREGYPRSNESQRQQKWGAPGQAPRDADEHDTGHDDNRLISSFMGSDSPRWGDVGRAIAAPLAQVGFGGNPFAAVIQVHTTTQTIEPKLVEEVSAKRVSGPLYPPVHAFLYAPLGFLSPINAYYVFHFVALAFGFLAGLGVAYGTRGAVAAPIAVIVLFLLPGCRTGLDLGQNPLITAAILTWGWALLARGYPIAGGIVWGLFAFKPIWGLAFVIVPLVMGRWRMVIAMCVTGLSLAALTVPFVGIQCWLDWLEVGKEATAVYKTGEPWNNLSRDLQGIIRRLMIDFKKPKAERNNPTVDILCWAALATVFTTTAAIYRFEADRTKCVGLGAAFLCFGAYLCGFRFMYYDAMLAGLGWACLFADRSSWLEPFESWSQRLLTVIRAIPIWILVIILYCENAGWLLQAKGTMQAQGLAYFSQNDLGDQIVITPTLKYELSFDYAWDTLLVLWIWLWCAWRLLLGDDNPPE